MEKYVLLIIFKTTMGFSYYHICLLVVENTKIYQRKSKLSFISLPGDKNDYHRAMFLSRLFLDIDITERTF